MDATCKACGKVFTPKFSFQVKRLPDGGAELDALFVEPHLWKRGIGRQLVDRIADVARERAAGFLHVIGNPHAEGFYVSCGFHVTGTFDTRFGPGLAMRRPL